MQANSSVNSPPSAPEPRSGLPRVVVSDAGPLTALGRLVSVSFVERGEIDMLDGAFVVVLSTGVRTKIPVGGVACLMPWAKPADRLDGPPSFAAKARGCAPGLLNF